MARWHDVCCGEVSEGTMGGLGASVPMVAARRRATRQARASGICTSSSWVGDGQARAYGTGACTCPRAPRRAPAALFTTHSPAGD